MRLPDTVGGARKVILAGVAVVLVVLGMLVIAPRLVHQVRQDEAVAVPSCVQEPSDTPAPTAPGTARPDPPSPTPDPAAGTPRALSIPDLSVDTSVLPLDLAAGGVLVPPADPTTVGWWSGGAEPGSLRGTVLLTGHTVSTGGGVFDDLADLEPGDLVHVTTDAGVVTYRVDAVDDYSKEQLARISSALFSPTVVGQLVLVTCSDYFAGDYHGNTVVVAHRPSAQSRPAD